MPLGFNHIFTQPFPIISSHKAKECEAVCNWPDQSLHHRRFKVSLPGQDPGFFFYENAYDKLPPRRLCLLNDVLMFNSLIFSRDGVFPECLRYKASNKVSGFSLPSFNPRLIPGSDTLYAFGENISVVEINRIKEPALPFYTVHEYGHYLTESLPMLWYLSKIKEKPRLVISPQAEKVPQYLLEMAAPFGLNEDDFVIPSTFTVFDRLYLPSRLYMDGQYQSQAARDVYSVISKFYAADSNAKPYFLYISRSSQLKRRLVNEVEVEKIFRDRGFTIIKPEEHSFPEQVRLFANAGFVAGAVGSGMHNIFFSSRPEDLRVLLLAPYGFASNKSFLQIEKAAGRTPALLYGEYLDPAILSQARLTYEGEWSLSISKLNKALDAWL